ncbi:MULTISPECIES: nucleoside hydrolase [Tenebrionibacter/Tenebrionicola group]|jgi:pyrimidine-specific ribonucleoside hydrolase|uniref:Nucleoside hydrolase n=2 Tax=Tenebrionibacter/Tenebrionicola group TaxID=2969848 RepID=A0A8K0V6T7_9ENTR|nr:MULTISPECIES: nucleoside hydrolase [Tenebrionibacter/Tenebrionicola group]MBK4715257.1 nucleoside hydrolase [Tenebrionibacter intestinalis]MBV5096003.1 nucleoside hydrolase [Tenebrionicola larvae]
MRIIIDCDPGNGIPGANVDDGLALALALAAPQMSLELITTVAGNTTSEVGYAVACDMLRQLGCTVPVCRGAAHALLEPAGPWRERMDTSVDDVGLRYLWRGVTPAAKAKVSPPTAANAIGELICNNPGVITLVAVGPLTNVAMALRLFPDMAQMVKRIVIMGGVFNVPGYLKDTNFGIDPEAAHVVLTSGAPITVVPMDTTTQTQMTHADLQRLAGVDNPITRYLNVTMRPWIDYSMRTRGLPGCWIHDALTIAWLLDPTLCDSESDYLDVALEGVARGATCRYGKLRVNVGVAAPRGAPVQILTKVDNARLLALIERYLQKRA